MVMRDIASYLAPNSTVTLVVPSGTKEIEFNQQSVTQKNITVDVQEGDITNREVLEGIGLDLVDHVVVFSCMDEHGYQEADSRTLVTLVHLRDIRDKTNDHFTIVSEILDVRNRELLELNQADDFILSERLVSLAMAQISENKELGPLFTEIFQPEGSEIYFKPVTNYVTVDDPLNFFTIVNAALERNETAIGYRQLSCANDADRNYGLVINPKKSDYVDYAETDQIIVFSEQ
tara:strand:- start:144 stop:842 length:699 start_codon:yes stop_codon:yes gene_type:complete